MVTPSSQALVFALLTALVLACAYVLWRALVLPRHVADRRPHCGRCGQEVAHPIPDICPECGTDVMLAGINTPLLALRHRSSPIGAIAAWTTLVLAIAAFAGPSITTATIRSLGGGPVTLVTRNITYSQPNVTMIVNGRIVTNPGPNYSIDVTASLVIPSDPNGAASPTLIATRPAVGRTFTRTPTTGLTTAPNLPPMPNFPGGANFPAFTAFNNSLGTTAVTPAGSPPTEGTLKADISVDGSIIATIEIDAADRSFIIRDAAGKVVQKGTEFDLAAMKAAYAAAGLDTSARNTAAECAQMVDNLKMILTQPQSPNMTMSTMSFSSGMSFASTLQPTRQSATTKPANRTKFLGAIGPDAERLIGFSLIGFAVLLWIMGCVGVSMRRRSLFRLASAPLPSTPLAAATNTAGDVAHDPAASVPAPTHTSSPEQPT